MKIIKKGKIDSAKYCEIVGDFIPYATALFPDGWILERDGPTPHTSRQTKDFSPKIRFNFCSGHPILQTLIQWKMCGRCLNLLWRKKIRKTKDELIQYDQESQHVM